MKYLIDNAKIIKIITLSQIISCLNEGHILRYDPQDASLMNIKARGHIYFSFSRKEAKKYTSQK